MFSHHCLLTSMLLFTQLRVFARFRSRSYFCSFLSRPSHLNFILHPIIHLHHDTTCPSSPQHNSPTFHLIHISQFSSIMSSSTDLRWCSSCKTSRKSADFAVKKNGELKKTCAIHQKKRTLDDTSLDSWNSFVTKLSKFNHPVQSANSKF